MIKVHPVNGGHSIKEAVISTFLSAPIIKPERFQELINTSFKDVFHQFETINQVQFQIKNEKGLIQNTGTNLISNRGFKFSAFKNGKLQKVLQAVNEETRSYISYHSLDYNRWKDFFEDYLEYIKAILGFHPNIFIDGISLHYIDEFHWENPQLEDLDEIFDRECSFLSKEFFKSLKTTYIIAMEQIKDDAKYLDRLEIKADPTINPLISISHNVTQPFNEPIDLLEFIKSEQFGETLMAAHLHNKKILKCLLKQKIKDLINLQ